MAKRCWSMLRVSKRFRSRRPGIQHRRSSKCRRGVDRSGLFVLFCGAMQSRWLRVTMPLVAVVMVCAIMSLIGCPDEPAAPAAVSGTQGRDRYVVTMTSGPVDLEEFRTTRRETPAGVSAYIAKKRAETAAAQADLDTVVASVGGQVLSRWWMSGQATIEVSPAAVATVRKAPGVAAVEPDQLLK